MGLACIGVHGASQLVGGRTVTDSLDGMPVDPSTRARSTTGDASSVDAVSPSDRDATAPVDVVCRVLGTEDSTPLQFSVALAQDAYLQLDDVVVTVRAVP